MGLEQMLDGFDELVAGNKTGAELIAILLTRYGEWATTEFGVCVVRLFNLQVSPKNARTLYSARVVLERKVRALFERGMADGSIKPCDASLAATALFGSLNWMAFWYDRSRAPAPGRGQRPLHRLLHGGARRGHRAGQRLTRTHGSVVRWRARRKRRPLTAAREGTYPPVEKRRKARARGGDRLDGTA
jgi:hypothetical protein